ncbi:MAG: hypothetical protein IJ071_08380 [Ruminococcus sp.]|nr:hypothetical protein [Ruminococcus sp.]
MKKILAFIMISAACIFAVACGEESNDASITRSIEAVTTTTVTTATTASTVTKTSTSTTVTTTELTTTTVQEETTTAPPETTTTPPETTVVTTTVPEMTTIPETTERVYDFVLNNNTMKAHDPNCKSVKDIKESNRSDYTGTISDLESMGYAPCGNCKPW